MYPARAEVRGKGRQRGALARLLDDLGGWLRRIPGQDAGDPLGTPFARGVEAGRTGCRCATANRMSGITPGTPPRRATTFAVKLSQRIRSRSDGACATGAAGRRISAIQLFGDPVARSAGKTRGTDNRRGRYPTRSESKKFQPTLSAAWLANALCEKYTVLWVIGMRLQSRRAGTTSSAVAKANTGTAPTFTGRGTATSPPSSAGSSAGRRRPPRQTAPRRSPATSRSATTRRRQASRAGWEVQQNRGVDVKTPGPEDLHVDGGQQREEDQQDRSDDSDRTAGEFAARRPRPPRAGRRSPTETRPPSCPSWRRAGTHRGSRPPPPGPPRCDDSRRTPGAAGRSSRSRTRNRRRKNGAAGPCHHPVPTSSGRAPGAPHRERQPASTPREMMVRWISLVPSPIVHSLTSR